MLLLTVVSTDLFGDEGGGGGSRVGGWEGADTETNTGGGEEEVAICADTHNSNNLEFIFEEIRRKTL